MTVLNHRIQNCTVQRLFNASKKVCKRRRLTVFMDFCTIGLSGIPFPGLGTALGITDVIGFAIVFSTNFN